MNTHFPTVPVETALFSASLQQSERLRPVALVVDDEPIITETLAAILDGSGLTALTALDGPAALEIAAVIPPEILITDLSMPGMNGLELAVEMTRSVPDCDVILFSGHISSTELLAKLEGLEHKFMVLLKPVHPVDLLEQVSECLVRRGISTNLLGCSKRDSSVSRLKWQVHANLLD